ncbi:MAG: YfdX family protein, partial [Acidobacteriaceae bacterium]
LLYGLTSEIRVRTYNLPLATYPLALTEAARLLDQQKNQDANTVLLTALNTLAIIDRVTPLPLVLARAGDRSSSRTEPEGQGRSANAAGNGQEAARAFKRAGIRRPRSRIHRLEFRHLEPGKAIKWS